MSKKWLSLFVVTLAILTGLSIAAGAMLSGMSLPSQLFAAKVPASVGDKPAPIPVLKIEGMKLTPKTIVSDSQIRRSINTSVGGQKVTPKFNLQEYQLDWKVSVEDGSLAPVLAQVFVPVIPAGRDIQQFPVIVYGAGTTGLADRCAPSRESLARGNMGDYRNYIISQASQGYIVVMPNYEGFDNSARNQHYFNKDNEARTMLSAGKALIQSGQSMNLPLNSQALFFGGYSQGGHAAFSAADYASIYVPDLKVAGVFGHGPTTDIAEYLISNPNLAAYFVASYSEYYPAIRAEDILEKTWIGYLDRAQKICVDEGFGINSTTVAQVFADPFEAALKEKTLATTFPEIDKVFIENNAGTDYTGIPTMVVQGLTDTVVTTAAQKNFVTQLCRRGVAVDLKEYKDVQHFATRQVSFSDTNAWIDAVSQGKTVTNSCSQILNTFSLSKIL